MRGSVILLGLLLAGVILAGPGSGADPQSKTGRRATATGGLSGRFRDNNCVICHSRITEPLRLTSHFYDWLGSRHEVAGVSCEKCHGGDPAVADARKSHAGVKSPGVEGSPLHPKTLAITCGACHQEVTAVFTRSAHSRKLEESGDAPSCTTCHQHMATAVINWPPATVKLCASCHNEKGSAPRHLSEPERAGDVIAAFSRADEIVDWTRYLIDSNPRQRPRLRAEIEEVKRLDLELRQSKLDWHDFNLEASRRRADEAFLKGYQLKESLWKKLPVN